ncbi:MAG: chloramphenicol resistance protein [Clostridia bacterium]
MIERLKEFFEECPLLEGGRVNINYLGSGGGDYSIENVPAEPVLKRYVDGGELRQYVFVFASREFYDENHLQNMETARFYEELCQWIERQNESGKLPALGGGLIPQKIEVTATGGISSSKAASARFQLQGRLIYKKEG